MSLRYQRARNAALILGVGLGGLMDGIALHPSAHWLHLATWLATLAGVMVLWSAASLSGRLPTMRTFVGYLLIGCGAFNLIEGTINHHVLFLGLSVGLVVVGLALRERRFVASSERRSGHDRRSVVF